MRNFCHSMSHAMHKMHGNCILFHYCCGQSCFVWLCSRCTKVYQNKNFIQLIKIFTFWITTCTCFNVIVVMNSCQHSSRPLRCLGRFSSWIFLIFPRQLHLYNVICIVLFFCFSFFKHAGDKLLPYTHSPSLSLQTLPSLWAVLCIAKITFNTLFSFFFFFFFVCVCVCVCVSVLVARKKNIMTWLHVRRFENNV